MTGVSERRDATHASFAGESPIEAYKWVIIAGDDAKQLTFLVRAKADLLLRERQKQEATRLADQWKFDKGLVKKPPAPNSDDQIRALYFVNIQQLGERCSKGKDSDLAWCEGYIAGAIDILTSGRQQLAADADDARLCIQKKSRSLREARQAVSRALATFLEDKASPITCAPAAGSIIAAVKTELCR